MKKYKKCSSCKKEELFEENNNNPVCPYCTKKVILDALDNTRRNHVGTYEEFNGGTNPYKSVPCNSRLPGGHYCDIVPGRLKDISVVVCMKCKDRITDDTLQECINEDEYALLE